MQLLSRVRRRKSLVIREHKKSISVDASVTPTEEIINMDSEILKVQESLSLTSGCTVLQAKIWAIREALEMPLSTQLVDNY